MMEETLKPELIAGEVKKQKPVKKENLKQRAYLNSLTSMIDYGGVQITGFIVSPFIVGGLGDAMYGIWKMLGQMTGYATMADSRASQVLKWTVAKKKDVADDEELRNDMASALVVTAIILPLVLLAGAVISWYAPYVANADPAYYSLIRITCSLLILSLAIARVFDLFEAVLRGMNLGYKRMGFRAGIVMCGGALKVFVITSGYGIIGLSAVQILITIITGLTFYFIVKKHVGWFGFGKTNFKNVVSFGKLSGWNMANTTTDTLLSNTDKVLLGFVAGPVMVSTYALTIFLPLAIQGMITRVIIGVMPGMGKLIGLQEYEKINRVRGNINDFIFLLTTASGVTIILFNHSFLNIWVGEGHYAGNLVNALVMLMLIQDTFIKHDGYLITATLNLKKKVYLTCISALVFLVSGYILINQLGMIGLCISLTGGKFLLFVGQRKFLKTTIQQRMVPFFKGMRPIVVSFSMLVIAYILSTFITPVSFVKLLEFAPLTFVGSFLLFYVTGLKKESRAAMVKIASSVKYFKSN